MYHIWLDDIRQSPHPDFIVVKNYNEAVSAVKSIIQEIKTDKDIFISFDHDLGSKKTGYDFAKWLVKNSIVGLYQIHSMNSVGAKNIRELLDHYGWREI